MMKRRERNAIRTKWMAQEKRDEESAYSTRITVCAQRWEKVLSDILDRMCATSRKAVQFINVIYREANALPEPRSFEVHHRPSAHLSNVFVMYRIDRVLFYLPAESRKEYTVLFMHLCVRACVRISRTGVTWHLRVPLVSADLSRTVCTVGRSFGLKCSQIPIHKLK